MQACSWLLLPRFEKSLLSVEDLAVAPLKPLKAACCARKGLMLWASTTALPRRPLIALSMIFRPLHGSKHSHKLPKPRCLQVYPVQVLLVSNCRSVRVSDASTAQSLLLRCECHDADALVVLIAALMIVQITRAAIDGRSPRCKVCT